MQDSLASSSPRWSLFLSKDPLLLVWFEGPGANGFPHTEQDEALLNGRQPVQGSPRAAIVDLLQVKLNRKTIR